MPDSFIRGYRLATTDPMGPVYICYDGDVQEKQLDGETSFDVAHQRRCRCKRRKKVLAKLFR